MNERTDQIARAAASLFLCGQAADVAAAIRQAAESFSGAEPPTPGRVRRHIRAMSMQAQGQAAYRESVRAILTAAEQMMTALEESMLEARTALMGRAAEGKTDGEVRLHIRVYTRASLKNLAEHLAMIGYAEPSFSTINTKHGRLNRLTVDDEVGRIILTRCPPEAGVKPDRSLTTGKPISSQTLTDLRRSLGIS